MQKMTGNGSFHYGPAVQNIIANAGTAQTNFAYEFQTFSHPFVGKLIQKLNETSVTGMLDPAFLGSTDMRLKYVPGEYTVLDETSTGTTATTSIDDADISTWTGRPYDVYNEELLFQAPVAIAVHLSNNQRFAEAQKWFHLVFDPTKPPPDGPWTSYAFRDGTGISDIATLLALLSTPDGQLSASRIAAKGNLISGYKAILSHPFDPYVVARTRPSAFQWYVVMKYLDNLIAWGDSLFLADTVETLNEATLCYVLAADILGPRPQAMPGPQGRTPRNFLQLKQAGLDAMANAMVALEGQFPFNLVPGPGTSNGATGDQGGALFGIGRSLYFCVPPNEKLLGYWDIVADRLFKIRNSENIQGAVQQLPLFDPPLDPGMLVKATAAGLDVGSIVSGLSQPIGPIRAPLLIQKALEIAGEVRSLGSALLSAYEKGDAEQLALLRQGHEYNLQQMVQNVRFLQWQHAQETTQGLLRTRDSSLERYTYYLSLLGQAPGTMTIPTVLTGSQGELTEDKFKDAYTALVGQYDLAVPLQTYPDPQLAQGSSPSDQAGARSQGQLYLNQQEDAELNIHLPIARNNRIAANISNAIATAVTPIPSAELHAAWWGIGLHSKFFSGTGLGEIAKLAGDVLKVVADYNQDQAAIAGRTAGYQRRVEEWTLQANLAARELRTIGRQILASILAEQVAYHDYTTVQTQVQQAKDVQDFLQGNAVQGFPAVKFTTANLYTWMQSDLSALYYQYYRFACDTARRAEQTMKQELMRQELDATQFIQYNYWDSGHQGLLSGEALYLDIKRMELAYHDSNKRELELTRHISLRQLDPIALLTLKITGSCTVTIPEWLYDRDCPGHYHRRIKALALSTPSVVGSNTSLNMTVSLQSSTVRVSPLLANGGYVRDTTQDDSRFVDYYGSTDTIVTSGGSNDSGMFETNLRDERFLPFEGAGAISTWNLSLPAEVRAFDYMTISDVILHVRYTARDAGDPLRTQATSELKKMLNTANSSGQALLFCLRYDFPTEWSAFVNGTGAFTVDLRTQFFPYAAQIQGELLTVDSVTLYAAGAGSPPAPVCYTPPGIDLGTLSSGLRGTDGQATLSLQPDGKVLDRNQPTAQAFLVLQYHFKAV